MGTLAQALAAVLKHSHATRYRRAAALPIRKVGSQVSQPTQTSVVCVLAVLTFPSLQASQAATSAELSAALSREAGANDQASRAAEHVERLESELEAARKAKHAADATLNVGHASHHYKDA